ncbi:hypothetical protein QFC21_005792 [Naganishia friedmannii]|uniref:Uncharacterized protein n=1 Tax=Naganishia friedmannii TaxID=89922 RepID=A0ACC2V755_9TREE|nr:hypothetical protein QFC21_005792 [Naganishia friedmannii]
MIRPWICLAGFPLVAGYRVDIKDTDQVREVCSGMYGGKNAHIDVTFDSRSVGQVALVIYEWSDVAFLGAETPDEVKTYICTTSAVRSGLCSKTDLGSFITTLPQGKQLEDTSIFTSGLRFASGSGSELPTWSDDVEEAEPVYDKVTSTTSTSSTATRTGTKTFKATATATAGSDPYDNADLPKDVEAELEAELEEALEEELEAEIFEEFEDAEMEDELEAEMEAEEEAFASFEDQRRQVKRGTRTLPPLRIGHAAATGRRQQRKRQIVDDLGLEELGMFGSDGGEDAQEERLEEILQELEDEEAGYADDTFDGSFEDTYEQEENASSTSSSRKATSTSSSGGKRPSSGLGSGNNVDGISAGSGASVPVYNGAITYAVPKTGYYCVGVVPVTLVNSRKRSALPVGPLLTQRQAEHAEYAGSVLFRNTFKGELPAAEYPKIGFYGFLSVLYIAGAIAWGYLCFQNRSELLPMQNYISGTIGFLVVEMIANFAYYRYINQHGGGSGSVAFLFIVAILNAARTSLSFFLLLIVSMGLSVVTPSLGSIMNRIRLLTAMHFIFGVIYAIGTVRIEIESASLFLVLFMIFPLALTLTAFLMWTIISLNGTITHLAARKQRHKLQMFKRLYRILMISVIAVAAFFVISSLSLSNRLEEGKLERRQRHYAPRNWKYRWILLDASLALIYLAAFGAIAYLWRPSRDNIRFAMSQELAQDEHDADDYEFGNLETRPVHHNQDYDDIDDEERGFISNENGHQDGYKSETVVFALEDEDSDEEHHHRDGQFRDEEEAEAAGDVGRTRDDKGKLD